MYYGARLLTILYSWVDDEVVWKTITGLLCIRYYSLFLSTRLSVNINDASMLFLVIWLVNVVDSVENFFLRDFFFINKFLHWYILSFWVLYAQMYKMKNNILYVRYKRDIVFTLSCFLMLYDILMVLSLIHLYDA